jgi:hypothetical protein
LESRDEDGNGLSPVLDAVDDLDADVDVDDDDARTFSFRGVVRKASRDNDAASTVGSPRHDAPDEEDVPIVAGAGDD